MKPNQTGKWADGDSTLGNAPVLMVKAGAGYKYFFYISNATDKTDTEVGYDCWADSDGYILDDAQQKKLIGNGFWVRFTKSDPAPAITFNGQVDNAASVTVDLTAYDNTMVVNPFPTALDFANLTFTGEITPGKWADGDSTLGDAPVMMVKAGAGYKYFFYISNATDKTDTEVGYDCWADSDGYILDKTTGSLPMGIGCWLRVYKPGKAVFASPMAKN